MTMHGYLARGATGVLLLALASCGGDSAPPAEGATAGQPSASSEAASRASSSGELTDDELTYGIGPIRDLELGTIDPGLAGEGQELFRTQCSACHKLDDRYVGPRLGTVLARRTPEFVMNMILNANEMVQRHPGVREMLAQFYTPMPVQVTDPDQARAILEYLRSAQIDTTTAAGGGS